MLNCMRESIENSPESKVLDVGANVGLLLTQLRSFNSSCHYVGVEPNVGNCFYCNILIEKNSFSNSWVYPVALGSENNVAKLVIKKSRMNDPGAYVAGYSVHKSVDNMHQELPITIMKGDDFAQKTNLSNISFIKIDVEGNECEVISGLSDTINDHRPDIFCEVTPESSPYIRKFLSQNNYSPYGCNAGSQMPEPIVWKDRMPFGNYLFRPNLSEK